MNYLSRNSPLGSDVQQRPDGRRAAGGRRQAAAAAAAGSWGRRRAAVAVGGGRRAADMGQHGPVQTTAVQRSFFQKHYMISANLFGNVPYAAKPQSAAICST